VDSKENKLVGYDDALYKSTYTLLYFNKAGVKSELLDTVKARKLAYYGHTTRKQGRKKKKIMQGTMLSACM